MSRWTGVLSLLVSSLLSGALIAGPDVAGPGDAGPDAAGPAAAGPRTTGLVAPEDGSALSTVLGVRDLGSAHGGTAGGAAVGTAGGTDRRETSLWGWPLAGRPEVVHRFDPPEQRWLPGHRGIDLAGVLGEPVLSVDGGVVAFSGVVAGVGVVSVDHASGLRSTYQPVSDRIARGTRVGRGDRLGRLDEGGHCVLRDCLHLGARRGRHHYVDPEPLLRPVTLTLLPLGAQDS